jgi:hypothetical protein
MYPAISSHYRLSAVELRPALRGFTRARCAALARNAAGNSRRWRMALCMHTQPPLEFIRSKNGFSPRF